MTSETLNTKQIHIKTFTDLSVLEDALTNIKEEDLINFQVSILGKVTQFYSDKDMKVSEDAEALKLYWEKVLGNNAEFGSFSNPEIGNVFVVGALASTFLYEVDDKTLLGMLSSGPYGILRGIGASESQVAAHLEMLNNDRYLLIFRGTQTDLRNYKRILEENENR